MRLGRVEAFLNVELIQKPPANSWIRWSASPASPAAAPPVLLFRGPDRQSARHTQLRVPSLRFGLRGLGAPSNTPRRFLSPGRGLCSADTYPSPLACPTRAYLLRMFAPVGGADSVQRCLYPAPVLAQPWRRTTRLTLAGCGRRGAPAATAGAK